MPITHLKNCEQNLIKYKTYLNLHQVGTLYYFFFLNHTFDRLEFSFFIACFKNVKRLQAFKRIQHLLVHCFQLQELATPSI